MMSSDSPQSDTIEMVSSPTAVVPFQLCSSQTSAGSELAEHDEMRPPRKRRLNEYPVSDSIKKKRTRPKDSYNINFTQVSLGAAPLKILSGNSVQVLRRHSHTKFRYASISMKLFVCLCVLTSPLRVLNRSGALFTKFLRQILRIFLRIA